MGFYLKDSDASIDYVIDWAAGYLGGRTVSESQWSIRPDEPGGVNITGEIREDTRTSVVLDGGVPGHIYRATNHVVLSDGLIDERSVVIRVEGR